MNTVVILSVLAYGIFLGYCFGRAVGYRVGSDVTRNIYK